jgi:hypothetical protein
MPQVRKAACFLMLIRVNMIRFAIQIQDGSIISIHSILGAAQQDTRCGSRRRKRTTKDRDAADQARGARRLARTAGASGRSSCRRSFIDTDTSRRRSGSPAGAAAKGSKAQ